MRDMTKGTAAPAGSRRRRETFGARSARWRAVVNAAVVAAAVGVVALAAATPCSAHENEIRTHLVIDTDLGVDDVVALSMLLQSPDLEVVAVVAGEGVADAATAGDQLARLVGAFNRADVRVFAAAGDPAASEPSFRRFAADAIDRTLRSKAIAEALSMTPDAFLVADEDDASVTVLALGPLTRLAQSLAAAPWIAQSIDRIVVSGDRDVDDNWNLAFDRDAAESVRVAGVPVVFVRPGRTGVKPDDWYTTRLVGGQRTSVAEGLLDRLLADPAVAAHYLEGLEHFHDELAALYVLRPELFVEVGDGVVEPSDSGAAAAIADELSRGRQRKDRVVFIDGPLPAGILRDDVLVRRDAILAANGPDEWFSQLLLNELHEHLGAYSIIGVKMGLRAAELLNAPQHAMTIVSSAPSTQPVSCLNDGLLVSTGSTPGRGLFSHDPGPQGTVEAAFSFNGRSVTLRLKDEYRARIRTHIEGLLDRYTLEDDEYWDGVRDLGLEIWQDWHRRILFEVVAGDSLESITGTGERP